MHSLNQSFLLPVKPIQAKIFMESLLCLLLGKPLYLKTSILSLSQFRSPSTSPWPTHDMDDYDQVSVVRAQGDAQAQSVTRGVVAGQGRGRGCGPGP